MRYSKLKVQDFIIITTIVIFTIVVNAVQQISSSLGEQTQNMKQST
jgi:hypothetical protein